MVFSTHRVNKQTAEDEKDEEGTVQFHRYKTVLSIGLTLLSSALLMSCASTKMTSTWRDSNFAGGPLKKIAFLFVEQDERMRRTVEDQATRSASGGTQIVPGYTIFPTIEKDKEKVKSRLIADGYDGALVGRLVAEVRTETYRPPQTYIVAGGPYSGMNPYFGSFDGYYGNAYEVGYSPGYSRQDTRYVVETLLYKLPEGKPIWTGTSESVNPRSTEELVTEIRRLVGKELRGEKLIVAP